MAVACLKRLALALLVVVDNYRLGLHGRLLGLYVGPTCLLAGVC